MELQRLGVRGLVVLALAGTVAACGDDDGPTGPANLDIEVVDGLYEPATITFDPQGSAPAADVLSALEEAGQLPTLNIARAGTFQLLYRDPVSGEVEVTEGSVSTTPEGVVLTFNTQAEADQLLFPRRLELTFNEEEQALTVTGTAQVSRSRLLQLFPELYADEQLFDPTPGTLTVGFVMTD